MAKKKVEGGEAEVTKSVGIATKCPVSRKYFADNAKPILAKIGETVIHLNVKEQMSTGSFGFHSSDKVVVLIGDTPVKCQANLLLTVVGSKLLGEK